MCFYVDIFLIKQKLFQHKTCWRFSARLLYPNTLLAPLCPYPDLHVSNIFEIFLCEIANNFLSDFSRIVNFFVLMWVTFFNIQIFLGLDNKHCQMHQMLKLAGNFLLCSCSWPSNQRAKSRYVKGRSKEGQRHVRVHWLLKSHSMQIKTRNWYVA